MNHFWRWARDETESNERTLYLEGVIAEESWYDDDVTPAMFKEELLSSDGPITLSINSPGGDTIAASQIYTMLKDYPGHVTVKITGIAASAASVVAMAGRKVCMSPTAMMMIHNPYTCAVGDSEEMRKAGQLLDEVKEGIINAYAIKTGLSRTKISHMMDDETWMNPVKAKELGFCDEILYQRDDPADPGEAMFFSSASTQRKVMNSLLAKVKSVNSQEEARDEQESEADGLPDETSSPEAKTQGIQAVEPGRPTEPEHPPEPGHPEVEEAPDPPENTDPQGFSADNLIQRLTRLKYNF